MSSCAQNALTVRSKYGLQFRPMQVPQGRRRDTSPAELLADYFKKRKALDHEIDKTLAEIQRILGIEINMEE